MIPFSREAFLGVFERYNQDVWPMQIALVALAVAAVLAARRGTPRSGRVAAGILAALWSWMGVVYHWLYFAPINPAAWAFGALFVAQAVLFVQSAVSGALRLALRRGPDARLGEALIGYALVVYPLLGLLGDHGFPRSPSFGLPCPTTIFTLGVLTLAKQPVPRRLLVIPILWAAVGTTASFKFGIWEDLGLAIAALLTVAARMLRRRASGCRSHPS